MIYERAILMDRRAITRRYLYTNCNIIVEYNEIGRKTPRFVGQAGVCESAAPAALGIFSRARRA